MHGKALLIGARDAVGLMQRNVEHVILLDSATMFMFMLIKVLVSVGTTVAAYNDFNHNRANLGLRYVSVPVTLTAIGAYSLITAMFDTYSMAINTIFFCFRM